MGEATTLPWTLKNYIKLSDASYLSSVRLYCVNLHTNSGKNVSRVLHKCIASPLPAESDQDKGSKQGDEVICENWRRFQKVGSGEFV